MRTVTVSKRQHDVVSELLRDAAGNKTIARRLHLTENSVATHLKRIYEATGFRSREALILAITTGRIAVVCNRTCGDCKVVNGHAKWCPKGEA